jgi:tetratricopeptide (TPR) repeat protein
MRFALTSRLVRKAPPPEITPATGTQWWLPAALCAITLLAYANSFGMGFAQDSLVIVLRDPRIRKATAENLGLILRQEYWWPTVFAGLYRPVTTASFLLNYAIFGNGENATGYHWVNFLLHAGNIWLVYRLSVRLLKGAWPAFFAAALWAVHPIGTESVTSIVGRADELAAMAVLAGLLLYVRGTEMRGARLGLAAAALFAIAAVGVFSKENAAVLLGLMLLWDVSFGTGGWRQGVLRRLPAYGAVAAALAMLWWMRHRVFESVPLFECPLIDNPLVAAGFWTGRLTAIKVIGLDLWLLVCPLRLSCDRSYNQIPIAGWPDASAWLALAVVGAIMAIALARCRRDPLIFFLAGFFGITLLPVSNLLFPVGSIMAERFLYLPSIGFAIAVVALAHRLGRRRHVAVVLAAVIALFTARTFARNFAWKDQLTLASTDVQTTPAGFRLHGSLATELFERDHRRNIDAAIREAEIAWDILRSLPSDQILVQTPSYLGLLYGYKGDFVGGASTTEGRAWYRKSLAVLLRAREADMASEKKNDEITLAQGKPLKIRPGLPILYLSLGLTYSRLDLNVEALEAYRYGRNMDPTALAFYDGIAEVYLAGGNPAWAVITVLEKALVDNNQPATMSALQGAYAPLPNGACAVVQENGVWKMNLDCPGVRRDLCTAYADLVQAFVEARDGATARRFKRNALELYTCTAAPRGAALSEGRVF